MPDDVLGIRRVDVRNRLALDPLAIDQISMNRAQEYLLEKSCD
jgi:hypothetical protein